MAEVFRFNAQRGEYGVGDIDSMIADRIALAKRFEPHRFLRKRPDGRFIDIRGEVIHRDDGAVSGFVSLYQDVTREKEFEQNLADSNLRLAEQNMQLQGAYEELREAQLQLLQNAKLVAVGQLAAGVAHEINNPMGFVMANQSMLKQNTEALLELNNTYEEHEKTLPMAARDDIYRVKESLDIEFIKKDIPLLFDETRVGLERVKQIVSSLQSFAYDRSGSWEGTDLAQELDRALAIAQHRFPSGTKIVRDYSPLPIVQMMRSDITQVLLSLLHNAGDALRREGGTITLRCGEHVDKIYVEITDTGSGISQENMTYLFSPFFTTKAVGSGTGLSLAVSERTVRNHGGKILVQSVEGKGSTFRVEFPCSINGDAQGGGASADDSKHLPR